MSCSNATILRARSGRGAASARGEPFHIRIELGMPGEELGVTHEPTLKHEKQGAWHMHLEVDVPHKDVHVAISRRIQGDAAAVAGLRALLAPRCEDALPGAAWSWAPPWSLPRHRLARPVAIEFDQPLNSRDPRAAEPRQLPIFSTLREHVVALTKSSMPADQSADSIPQADLIRLFLCGDVMTGRGIDQVLPHPTDPTLHEPYIGDARSYVERAESVNGAIPRPVEFDYIWGDALAELDRAGVDLRIINLETSITSSEDYWRDKEIHYRMHPRNIECITAARIDCCCLANNHVLDWGYDGLAETLRTLDAAGIAHTGAGRDAVEAAAPAVLEVPGKGRVLVFSYGSPTSGVPWKWAATAHRPGINFLEDTSKKTARRIAREMRGFNRQCDVIVASIHWGGNWGYRIRDEETCFAHQLIEHGIAVVHGHSSHHVKTAEIHSDRLVLYGCGDFLNDYEGISGYEVFRSDLTLMYLPAIDPRRGELLEARLVPMRVARFRLNRGAEADAEWLCDLLNQLGAPLGTRGELAPDHTLTLHPFT